MHDHSRGLEHADALLDLDRPAEAEQHLRDVLAHDPDSSRALVLLSRALLDQDRTAEAETAARRGIALSPDDVDGYIQLCDILCSVGQGPGAIATAKRCVELDPHAWRSHYVLSNSFLTGWRPRPRDAYDAARQAVALGPHVADTHNLVGICLSEMGDEPGA